jgi:hypothetical protein
MWCQFDWGEGPMVPWAGGAPRATLLFCLWLAWSRFRVVIPERTWGVSLQLCKPRMDQDRPM